jgi:hypothetical protein
MSWPTRVSKLEATRSRCPRSSVAVAPGELTFMFRTFILDSAGEGRPSFDTDTADMPLPFAGTLRSCWSVFAAPRCASTRPLCPGSRAVFSLVLVFPAETSVLRSVPAATVCVAFAGAVAVGFFTSPA